MSAPIRVALHVPPWLSIRIPAFRLVCKLRDCKLESGRCPAPEDGLPPPKGPFPRCDVPFLTATLPGYDERDDDSQSKERLGGDAGNLGLEVVPRYRVSPSAAIGPRPPGPSTNPGSSSPALTRDNWTVR